jgi:MoxR-like ATPase
MDRFLLRSSIGYPTRDVERQVMSTHRLGEPVDELQPVVSADQICRAQEATRNVRFDESLVDYLLEIVDGTRSHEAFQVGVSTRGALSYYRGCQAKAITEERDFVTPDDVKSLAVPCLAHRLLSEGMFQDVGQQAIAQHLTELVESISVPM